MKIHEIDYMIIVLYIIVIIAAGVIGSIRAKNKEDYLVAGRSLPLPVFVACMSTVVIGGGATFGAATQGFRYGVSGVWMVTMFGVGILSLGFLLSTKLSNLHILTISEMLSIRYSKHAAVLSAIISVFYTMMIAVTNAIALGVAFSAIMGWRLGFAIFVACVVALAYSLLGGMTSVAIADTIQFTIMTITIFFFLVPFGYKNVNGFSGLQATLPPEYFNLFSAGGERIFSWFILFALGLAIGQDIWQRVFSAKNADVARIGTLLSGIYVIIWAFALTFSGIVAFALMPDINPQNALSEVVIAVAPTGIRGLVFAGIMSAFLSTISGCMLASSTLILNDILRIKDATIMKTRAIVLSVGIVITLIAVIIQNVLTALDIAYAILSGCIFVPVIAGFFWKRATWKGAVGSMVLSFASVVCSMLYFGPSSTSPIMIGLAVSFVSLILISLMTEKNSPQQVEAWESKIK